MRIEVTGGERLRVVSRQLKTVTDGKAMRRDMLRALRTAVRPAVAEAKRGALALPAKGTGVQQRDRRGRYASGHHSGTNLRRRMAAATSAKIRTTGRRAGVSVGISWRTLGEQAPAARKTDRASWRHPVFGNREAWVTQRGQLGWFERANQAHTREVREGLETVLKDIERKVGRAH